MTGPLAIAIVMSVVTVLASGAAGAVMALLVLRREDRAHAPEPQPAPEEQPRELIVDPGVSDLIHQAASDWAEARNWPEAAALVENRLRLSLALMEANGGRWPG
jgi:hypothetical protein